jgi:anti-sigma28 factor (negative regulator of flagellin synthesis)
LARIRLKRWQVSADMKISWKDSMRIYDRDLTGAASTESGRSQETQKTDRDATTTSSQQGSPSGDRVELSSGLASVSRALAAYGSEHTNKVQQLSTQFQSGSYTPSSLAISQGIVTAALSGGAS